jgi:RimJ/RimL family protein N-acetyltransferase
VLKNGNTHIGNTALQQINWVNRSAEWAILIGDKNAWGKGYAFEAAGLMMMHGFSSMNLNRIACGTFEDNIAMNRLAVKIGMREEGRRRSAAFKGGRFVDVVEYGILRSEFRPGHQSPASCDRPVGDH